MKLLETFSGGGINFFAFGLQQKQHVLFFLSLLTSVFFPNTDYEQKTL